MWIVLLVVVAILALCGCVKTLTRTLVEPSRASTLDHRSPYLKVHMRNGVVYVLSAWSVDAAAESCRGSGDRLGPDRKRQASGRFAVPIDSVAVFETNVSQTAPAVAALTLLTGVSLALSAYCIANPKSCFGSCPTFYVSDGESLILQAEGFSSSIAPSLERTDVDALYRARPSGPTLVVRMTNEALETHVVRSVNLLVAPRPPGGRVLATGDGSFVQALAMFPPVHALAPEGDCTKALQRFDGVERFSPADSFNLAAREIIELEFSEVPAGARGLVLATRQTLLTTYLYYQALAYMGSRAGEWLAAMERMDDRKLQVSGGIGAAVGEIEVLVPGPEGEWQRVGADRETGPLATDMRVVPLGVGSTSTVRVRLRLTRGAWRLDHAALALLGDAVIPLRIAPARVSHDGKESAEALDALRDPDQVLVTVPGDVVDLVYPLPKSLPSCEFFLESRGYYLEWMREAWLAEEDASRAALMLLDPERALRVLAPAFKAQESGMEAAFWGSRYARP